MVIEKSKLGRPDEGESKEAESGYERICSSDETAVMAIERRDSIIYTSIIKQPEMGDFMQKENRLRFYSCKC